MKTVLEVRGLEKNYGRRKVVNGVNFTVHESEIVGLLGPNGAGKSTSFKMTCGIVTPDRGQVFLGEQEVTECRCSAARTKAAWATWLKSRVCSES